MSQESSTLAAASENVYLDPGLCWYALYTRHQHEKSVAELLSQKHFEVFVPLYNSVRRWKDRRKALSLPLFPCYVFVRGGLDRRLHVLMTPGVHSVLTSEGRVALIPESEIAAVRRAVEGPLGVEPHPFLKCGDRVRVKWGALEGVEGILVRKKNVYRLVISVEMLAQSAAIEVDASDVEPVASRDENARCAPHHASERDNLVWASNF